MSSVRASNTIPVLGAFCQDPVFASSWRRFCKWISAIVSSFFCPRSEISTDPLVSIARQDPVSTLRFIKTVMTYMCLASTIACSSCAFFLLLYWGQSHRCDRPLRWWLLLHTLLQFMRVTVRWVFLANVQSSEAAGGSLETCVCSYTSSLAWRSAKNISLLTHGWFALGIVWVRNSGGCTASPGVYWMTIAVMAQAIARGLIGLACCRLYFSQVSADGVAEMTQVKAAKPSRISSLPLVRFHTSLFSEEGAACAICLCDFEIDESLRKLPCGHYFHQACADKWLRRSMRCPLCVRQIDANDGIAKRNI